MSYHPIPEAPVAANAIPIGREFPTVAVRGTSREGGEVVESSDPRVRWIHFLLGCAILLPWNAMITATPYFLSRVEGSSFQSSLPSYMSATFTAANFLFLAHATATAKHASNTRRVLISLGGLATLCFLLALSTYVHTPPSLFFAFVLFNGVAQAAFGSYLQCAVIATAALLGPVPMVAVMSGFGAVAVAISSVQLVSAAASATLDPEALRLAALAGKRTPEERSALAFFALSAVFLVICAGMHVWLIGLPEYKAVVRQGLSQGGGEDAGLLAADESGDLDDFDKKKYEKDYERVLRVSKLNKTYNVGVAYVYIVTLSVFPAITVAIRSTSSTVHPLVFSAIHFLVFNIGDFIGRTVCSVPRVQMWSARKLLVLSLARTLFIPLFLLCNVQWATATSSSPTESSAVITSDALFMLLMALFGASNGYVSSMLMTASASVTHNPKLGGRVDDVDVAATLSSFCISGGLAVGSILSFAVSAAVCRCNPFIS